MRSRVRAVPSSCDRSWRRPCNQVFYLGCHRAEAGALALAAFIHVPPMDDFTAFEAGLRALLKML